MYPRFPTGNALTDGAYSAVLRIPKSQQNWVLSVFIGVLEYMTRIDTWFSDGETTPDEATSIFQDILWSLEMGIFSLGVVQWFAAAPDASHWLLCDGTLYAVADYPDLAGAIGDVFTNPDDPTGFFRVPDVRGRVIAMTNNGTGRLPAFADDLGGTGGESDHTLIVTEMPSHSHSNLPHTHSEIGAVATVINGGLEAPAASAAPILTSTGPSGISIDPAGGDAAHNNVQPTIVLSAWILAVI
jgi:microcystin-dependent protein